MKPLQIEDKIPRLVQADICIHSAYQWEDGWKSKDDAAAFSAEISAKLPFGDFTKWDLSKTSSKLFNTEDERQYVYCHPMVLSYVGDSKGLSVLEEKMKRERFSSFSYIKTEGRKEIYDVSLKKLEEILDKNKDVIRENIRERVTEKQGSPEYRVIDDVFEACRIVNMAERNYLFSTPQELSYRKVEEVFRDMVKNKEIVINKEGQVVTGKQQKKPLRVKKTAKELEGVERNA